MSDGVMTYEDWLRGCVHHDGRHGYVTLPCDEVLKIADFIERLRADRKTENSSEKPNNCETCANGGSYKCSKCDGEMYFKDEPQTYCDNCMYLHCNYECAGEIVHKMIDDAVIAEDVYPDLRQRMHDAVDEYEPQTDNGIGCSRCEGRFDCYDRDMPYAVRCNNYGKITDEPQTERSE